MQRKPRHQVIKLERRNIVSLLAVSSGIGKQRGHRLVNIAVAASAPVQCARAVRAASIMQGLHNGMIAPSIAADNQRPLPHLFDQGIAQSLFLTLKLVRDILERVITVVAVQRHAQQLAFARLAGESALRVYPYFKWRQTEVRCGASGEPVEIRGPDGTDNVDLCEMAKKTVTNIRLRTAYLLLKISTPVIRDGEALLNVEPILLGCALVGICALVIEPLLNPALYTWKRQLRELVFEARIVREE